MITQNLISDEPRVELPDGSLASQAVSFRIPFSRPQLTRDARRQRKHIGD